jgi:hypothetical protein
VIKAVDWYIRREILTRLSSILNWSSALWVAVITATLLGRCGAYLIPETTKVGAIAAALLTYSAIALGFSLAGLTLVLTIPSTNFVNLLCDTKLEKKKHNAYADLIFVFSWTAVIHWIVVFVSIVLVLFVNPDQRAFQLEKHRLKSGLVSGLSIYALFQFLVTLITLAQVGATYVSHLQREAIKKVKAAEEEAKKQAIPLTSSDS